MDAVMAKKPKNPSVRAGDAVFGTFAEPLPAEGELDASVD